MVLHSLLVGDPRRSGGTDVVGAPAPWSVLAFTHALGATMLYLSYHPVECLLWSDFHILGGLTCNLTSLAALSELAWSPLGALVPHSLPMASSFTF